LKQKVTDQGEGRRVWVSGIPEFIATTDSEASNAESPRFEGVAGANSLVYVPGGVGTAPMEDVVVEEVRKKIPTSTLSESDRVNPVGRGW